MIHKPLKYIVMLALLAGSLDGFTQITKRSLFGVNVYEDLYPGEFHPSPGISFERQVRKHAGFETGLLYLAKRTSGVITISSPSSATQSHSFTISQRHLVIPILYKYYSRIVNLSAGPSIGINAGWKQKDESSVKVTNVAGEPDINFGYLLKAGREFKLRSPLTLEPEIRFGSVKGFSHSGIGIGLGLKYSL